MTLTLRILKMMMIGSLNGLLGYQDPSLIMPLKMVLYNKLIQQIQRRELSQTLSLLLRNRAKLRQVPFPPSTFFYFYFYYILLSISKAKILNVIAFILKNFIIIVSYDFQTLINWFKHIIFTQSVR